MNKWLCILVFSQNVGASQVCSHALSLKGEPLYSENAKNLYYVNPDARVFGSLRLSEVGTFNHFNPYASKGVLGQGTDLMYESLLSNSADDLHTAYGLLAKSICIDKDSGWVVWYLQPGVTFHGGKPLTARDVIYSIDLLKNSKKFLLRQILDSVKEVDNVGEDVVRMRIVPYSLDTVIQVGSLPILSANEQSRLLGQQDKWPSGTGPYYLDKVDRGRSLVYKRRADYWGSSHFLNKGRFNFQKVTWQYFLSDHTAFMSFLAGKLDFWQESSAKRWHLGYHKRDGVNWQQVCVKHQRPPNIQGFMINMRRPVVQEPLIRELLIRAMDFDWLNRTMFFNQYKLLSGYFPQTEYAANKNPSVEEIELAQQMPNPLSVQQLALSPVRQVSEIHDALMKKGYRWEQGLLVDPAGNQVQITIPYWDSGYQRILVAYREMCHKVGIRLEMELLSVSDYLNVLRYHNYDMTWSTFLNNPKPNHEQKLRWHSSGAEKPSSINLVGLKDQNIDWLLGQIETGQHHRTALLLLDRLLRSQHLMVPHWYADCDRIAYSQQLHMKEHPRFGPDVMSWEMGLIS